MSKSVSKTLPEKIIRTISTSELPFAAYLKVRYRLPLADIQKATNGRVSWTFELQDKDETTLTNEFWRGGQVSASEYYFELKSLRSTTYGI